MSEYLFSKVVIEFPGMRELVMTPVDKTPEKEKETAEVEDDPRHDWVKEDIVMEDRKPNLEEIEEDTSEL
jgi:hypothetical protein